MINVMMQGIALVFSLVALAVSVWAYVQVLIAARTVQLRRDLKRHNKATGANKPLDERFAGMTRPTSIYRYTSR